MNQNLWRWDRPLGFWVIALAFLALEIVLRTKLGSLFMLIGVWGILAQALNRRSLGLAPAVTGETFLRGFVYAFWMSAFIFAAFAVGNIGLRSLNNAWTFFQLP